MTHYRTEPRYEHGTPEKTGILLVNLGTPEAPTPNAVRAYLKEFLWDKRVVEIPRPIWWLVLNGIILNVRPKKSAAKYGQIWSSDGSPLKVHTERQATLLLGYLGQKLGKAPAIEYGMRYGAPSIPSALDKLKQQNCQRILVVPLYPQYAASTTGSAVDTVCDWLKTVRNQPAVRIIKHFHDHPGYIAALARTIHEYWERAGRPDRLVMSFHGLPRYTLEKGDPYHCECQKTARLLGEELGLNQEEYAVCFQSRFGRAEWLKPYTARVLEDLGRRRTGRVDVICPGFISDCLETLEEIAIEGRAVFLNAGGGEFHYIPCLNERDEWMRALVELTLSNLDPWLQETSAQEVALSRDRALKLGAKS